MNKTLLTLSAFMLGTASIMLPVYADNSMAGMDMGSKTAAQKPPAPAAKLSVTATLNPAAPQTGENTLDLLVRGPDGKPVTGLKLTASVAMTSMDMGTTHPAFTETGGGHYAAKVSFGMDGLWRVVVRSVSGKVAVLDFNAGSKTPWKSPPMKAVGVAPAPPAASTQPAAPAATAMPGMDMSGGKTMDKKADDKADDKPAASGSTAGTGTPDTAGMKMSGIADMKTATVPELKETGTYTATDDENWKMQTGFGHNAPMVGMMNQMMVGGSGMEGMKMAPMDMKFGDANYTNPGASDAGDSTAGIKMDTPAAGGAPTASARVSIAATTPSAPKAGDNPLLISVTDAEGKPVAGATITASVAMTSMDMGTTHPAVTEKGGGQYTSTVNFSMAGLWRVKVKVTAPGQKPQTEAFDFAAK